MSSSARTYTQDQHEAAKRAYMVSGNLTAVARQLDIPRATMHQWKEAEKWDQERKGLKEYGADVRRVKVKLLRKLADSDDPDIQAVYAWGTMEARYPEHKYNAEADPQTQQRIALATMEEFLVYLAEEAPELLKPLKPHLRPFMGRFRPDPGPR